VERAPYEMRLAEAEVNKIRAFLSEMETKEPNELDRIHELVISMTPENEKAVAIVVDLERSDSMRLRVILGLREFDTGGGVFRSDNRGETWQIVNKMFVLQKASYYSHIYVHPLNENTVYVSEVCINISMDGGEQAGWAFSSWLTTKFIHGDFHLLWTNSDHPDHMIVGTDGGLYSSYDKSQNWEAHHMLIGQFHTTAADRRKPYYIYEGMEDSGGWAGPSATRHFSGITNNKKIATFFTIAEAPLRQG
jgi:hypothetical protein